MSKVTVLIVAATPIMRAGVQTLLAHTPDIAVIGEAAGQSSLTAQLSQQAPGVVLVCMDHGLDMSSSEIAHIVKTLQPSSKILLLAAGQEAETLRTAIAAGMDGYLPFGLDPDALIRGIRDVIRYGLILAEDMAQIVRAPTRPETSVAALATLSDREREVLQSVAQGRTNLEIARELNISGDTVRTHLKHIYAKLEVESRAALLRIAVYAGLGDAPQDSSANRA